MSVYRDIVERLRVSSSSPKCAEWVEAEDRAEREEAAKRTRMAQEAHWRESGIPERVIDLLRLGIDSRASAAGVRKWLSGCKTFMVLARNPGPGKTVAAGWAVSERPGGAFVKARDVAWMGQYDHEARQRLIRASVLALDDLGAEPEDKGGWGRATIYGIIDSRYDAKARTIITTNLSHRAITERYGQDGGRLFRRLREDGEWLEVAS